MIEAIIVLHQDIEAYEDDGFNPFLFALLIIGLIIIGIGVFIGIVVFLAILALFAIGSLSGSLVVGLQKRSFTSGFKTFIILFSIACCTFLGGVGTWLFNKWTHWWTISDAILIGISSGLLAGTAIDFSAAYIIRVLSIILKEKLQKYSIDKKASANTLKRQCLVAPTSDTTQVK